MDAAPSERAAPPSRDGDTPRARRSHAGDDRPALGLALLLGHVDEALALAAVLAGARVRRGLAAALALAGVDAAAMDLGGLLGGRGGGGGRLGLAGSFAAGAAAGAAAPPLSSALSSAFLQAAANIEPAANAIIIPCLSEGVMGLLDR
jgi:hypothetical protein